MVTFKSKRKIFDGELKIKLNGKRLDWTESVKSLDIKINANLTLQHHINDVCNKLDRANALLFKVRKLTIIY